MNGELSGLPNFSEKPSEQDFQNEEKGPLGQRKRRRLIGNLDNTLDGLVAKRADLPLKKRYQSETEAIELPDDEQEMKRMETDPDVCTRMCSVCGYQGKWVSEMIRHKRVHTNDRPFKCKYCNRTSKWKADLIRHVAKTHGIRVVSKYSRSKAFDFGKNSNKSSTEQQLTIDDPSYPLLVSHLLGVHNTSPFCCQSCNRSFTQIVSAAEHFATDKCPPNALKWNFLVDSVVGNEHFEANQHPLNLFGQRLAASASNNILFHQNMHQNANFNGFGGLLPPAIFPYGLPTMAFPPQYSGHSIAQLHGIGQNCCSPGSAISTAPSYASLINNNCEKPNQLEKNNEDDNVEIVEDLKREIKSSQSPELKIPAPVPHNSKLQQKHSPLEAETANKNEQNLDDTEDFCVNVDDIKVEEEKSGDELQNEDAIKNTSLAALMLLNVVQMQQKLTALEDVPKTTQPEQFFY
uniref:C2H2-type domain-containing protein n=1 Tax=Meloidogyne javanica TaxID=6303 RepID=A0A915LUT5_MELJA